jgi:tetratricopeptide (TPR) repeat protein
MDYSLLNPAIEEIKELEEKGAFAEALSRYESLLGQDPDEVQRLIIATGKATTLLIMKEPRLALAILEKLSFDGFDPSASAVAYNVRANALHECEKYTEARSDAIHARNLAQSATEIDPEIVVESIAREGFALASLGQLKEAIELFDLAEAMSPPSDIRASIQLFRDYCHERTMSMLVDAHDPPARPN